MRPIPKPSYPWGMATSCPANIGRVAAKLSAHCDRRAEALSASPHVPWKVHHSVAECARLARLAKAYAQTGRCGEAKLMLHNARKKVKGLRSMFAKR